MKYPALLFILASSNCFSQHCSDFLHSTIFDSIPVHIEYFYFQEHATNKLNTAGVSTHISSTISHDDPAFWKTLILDNIDTCALQDSTILQFVCGCPYLKITVSFIGSDTVTLWMNSCDIVASRGLIVTRKQEYRVRFDTRINGALKEYLRTLFEIALPDKKHTACGLE